MKPYPKYAPDWQAIDTVLLDMDGTLLDLHFDNYFWQIYVPQCYAQLHHISVTQAHQELDKYFIGLRGSLNWYCLDFWSELTGLNIAKLKEDVADKIQYRPHSLVFLQKLRQAQKRCVIITNAHPDSVALKKRKTNIHTAVDRIISSHDYHHPKESPEFWQCLQQDEPFDAKRTLFIDDSQSVLASAATWGVKWLVSVNAPDSKQAATTSPDFFGIHSFTEIMPT